MMDVCGATIYRGILGYGAKGHTQRRSHLHQDLPIMISIVERAEKVVENPGYDRRHVEMIRLIRKLEDSENAQG